MSARRVGLILRESTRWVAAGNTKFPSILTIGGRGISSSVISRNSKSQNRTEISRFYHKSIQRESTALIFGGVGLIVASIAAEKLYRVYKSSENQKGSAASKQIPPNKESAKTGEVKEESPSWFSTTWFARNFYDGGFEDKMSKREAALILGVRESATPERIKDAHRRILLLNHPDRGGSAHIAAKVNEAKELLMRGKQG